MNRIIVSFILCVIGLMCNAQENVQDVECQGGNEANKAEVIESIAVNSHETEWYAAQILAWQKVVDENPEDQWAWRNLFRAAQYVDMGTDAYASMDENENKEIWVLNRMKKAVPDSFVYHLCMARLGEMSRGHLECAIELLPENAYTDDVSFLAAQSWCYTERVSEEMTHDLFVKAYKMNAVPERIMRYNWNMLQSMEPNAIYFGNGDNCLIPMKILQEVLGIRKDVRIVPLSFAMHDKHLDWECEKMQIKPFENNGNYEYYANSDSTDATSWMKKYYAAIIKHIIKETKRPVYFFPDIMYHSFIEKDNLYNEGLLLKYSEEPYDNFAVAMRNVREKYHLEYLAEPSFVYTPNDASEKIELNHVHLLGNICQKFVQNGEQKECDRLLDILTKFVKNSHLAETERQDLLDELLMYSKGKPTTDKK